MRAMDLRSEFAADQVDESASSHEEEDPVLKTLMRAPLVPLTKEEKALLEELEQEPIRWIPDAEFGF